ncbi:MAG TPA: tetratricopeptide repeat protein, partial [Sorangium sp.]|nr:tetratricopeptide repeat protein [Sorangium sp.]
MPERDDPRPSTREVAAEEFLFHLHRGSELLQDNRVHAAKAELERALSLQPSDPKGQDLLGIVYFRLGLYPRAIAIYERLIQAHPDAVEPRINLALSYLKTGQPAQARSELEKALEQNPKHQRAWGYLGLAFQRMGDYERASHAFAAGGHDAMARRLLDMTSGATGRYPIEPPDTEDQPPIEAKAEARAEVQRAAGEAVQALERTGAGFRHDSDLPRIPSGTWSAIEPGRETMPTIPAPPSVRSLGADGRPGASGGAAGANRASGPRGGA